MLKTKKITIISVILLAGLLIAVIFYWQIGKSSILQKQSTQISIKEIPSITFSEEELTKLWINGVRCPKKGFSAPFNTEDNIIEGGVKFYANVVIVDFVFGVTCEDAERIAQLINARIRGFGPTTNIYSFLLPSRTKEELDTAIAKVKALNDPKIEGVSRGIPIRAMPLPSF